MDGYINLHTIINDMQTSLEDILPNVDAAQIILSLEMMHGEFRHLKYQFRGEVSESDKQIAADLLSLKCSQYRIQVYFQIQDPHRRSFFCGDKFPVHCSGFL